MNDIEFQTLFAKVNKLPPGTIIRQSDLSQTRPLPFMGDINNYYNNNNNNNRNASMVSSQSGNTPQQQQQQTPQHKIGGASIHSHSSNQLKTPQQANISTNPFKTPKDMANFDTPGFFTHCVCVSVCVCVCVCVCACLSVVAICCVLLCHFFFVTNIIKNRFQKKILKLF